MAEKRWGWVVMAAAFTNNALMFGTYKCLGIFFVEISEVFESSATVSSVMYTIVQSTMCGIVPITFPLMERVGHRRVMMVGAIAGGLSFFLTSFATNITYVLLVFGILFGVCFGCLYGVGNIILSKHFADHPRKGLANGIACAGTGVGSLTLPLLMRYIISTYGLRGALQVYGGCMLQMCVATAVCRPVEKEKTEISQRSTTGNGKVGYKTELRHGSFLESILASFPCCNSKLQDVEPLFQFHLLKKYDLMIILIGHSLIYASYVCCYLYLPPYAAQIGVRKTDTSLILTIGGVCELFARVTTGWVADLQVVKARNIIALSMIVGGMAAIVMPFFTTRELLIAFMIVEGLAGACMGVAIVLAVVESVDQNELTHAFVLLTVSVPVSMASLPPLIGYVRDVTGDYSMAFQLCGALMIIGCVLILSISGVQLFRKATHQSNYESSLPPEDLQTL